MDVSPWPSKKNASGILTGSRGVRGAFLSARTTNQPGRSNLTPSLSQRTDLDESEEDIELMLYLSHSKKKSSVGINWGKIDDLSEAIALSDNSDISLAEHNHFLKPKKDMPYSDNTDSSGNENIAGSHTYYTQKQSTVVKQPQKPYNKTTTTDDINTSSESNNSHFFKKHIFALNELEADSTSPATEQRQRLACEGTELQTDSIKTSSKPDSSDEISEKVLDEKKKAKSASNYSSDEISTKSISESVVENLELTLTDTEENIEEKSVKVSELDDKFNTTSSQISLISQNGSSETDSTVAMNELSSMQDSVVADGQSASSAHYTMEYESASESSDTGTETTFQTYTSDEHKVCHEARSTIDTGTQTNVVDTKVQHLSSSLATPTASVGPPKYSTDYSDPTPIVLPKDTLEVLTAYSPNVLALNDMIRSQLVLTRQLLENQKSLTDNLTASLNTQHQYTTLEDTRKYIKDHRPKVLTLKEVQKRIKHKH